MRKISSGQVWNIEIDWSVSNIVNLKNIQSNRCYSIYLTDSVHTVRAFNDIFIIFKSYFRLSCTRWTQCSQHALNIRNYLFKKIIERRKIGCQHKPFKKLHFQSHVTKQVNLLATLFHSVNGIHPTTHYTHHFIDTKCH